MRGLYIILLLILGFAAYTLGNEQLNIDVENFVSQTGEVFVAKYIVFNSSMAILKKLNYEIKKSDEKEGIIVGFLMEEPSVNFPPIVIINLFFYNDKTKVNYWADKQYIDTQERLPNKIRGSFFNELQNKLTLSGFETRGMCGSSYEPYDLNKSPKPRY